VDAEGVRDLRLAALLHDLGKGHVPLALLDKPGRFTPEEHLAMQGHARLGFEVARALQLPDTVSAAIRHHHERWDGTGYPDGLAGAGIPVAARILTVADIFDALTSDRPYRRALSERTALEIMAAESGRTVDPTLLRVHSRLVHEAESTLPAVRLAAQRAARVAVAAA
jgi:putative nucleotidyltransferase with HDIG domain